MGRLIKEGSAGGYQARTGDGTIQKGLYTQARGPERSWLTPRTVHAYKAWPVSRIGAEDAISW